MMKLFQKLSGWDALVERYQAAVPSSGQAYAKQTVQVGPVRYRRCVTVHVGEEGLFLQPRFLLARYPAITIPWHEIVRVEDAMLYWRPAKRLSIGKPEVGTVTVLRSLYALMQSYLVRPT
jgi:hypothetical protein